MKTIYNPAIPFWSLIPEGVDVGTVIRVYGETPHLYRRFSIDLMCGQNITDHDEHHNNIALHFNPRYNEWCIVLNTRHNQLWGDEDRKEHAFLRLKSFYIKIQAEHECYEIYINGKHFANFNHRLPLSDVKSLRIDGEVCVNFIEYSLEKRDASTRPPQESFHCRADPLYYGKKMFFDRKIFIKIL